MDSDRILELAEMVQAKQSWFAYFVRRTLAGYGLLLNKEDIEDVISESFLKASTKLMHNQSLNVKNYHAWFTKILYYTSLSAHKKKLINNKWITESDMSELADYVDVENFINESNNKELINKIMKQLDDKEKEIVLMSIVGGHTSKEIAQKLEIKEAATVRKIKSRAIGKIKEKIN